MSDTPPHLLIRIFLATLLGVFAFAPCYIAFWTIVQIAIAPLSTSLEAVVVLAICLPVAHFLVVLTYRALTWRGRRSDGGLVPPVAMLILAFLFALLGVAGVVLTLSRSEYLKSVLAFGYLVAAIPVIVKYWPSRHAPNYSLKRTDQSLRD